MDNDDGVCDDEDDDGGGGSAGGGGVDADGPCSQEEKTVRSSSAPRQEMKAVLQNSGPKGLWLG